MTRAMVVPSQVTDKDRVALIGADPCRVLWTRPGGWSAQWQCPVTDIAVAGAPEVLHQPEKLRVEVWR